MPTTPYRQDSDFYYLSGFNEPDAVLALIPKRKHGEVILFCRERDPEMETWHGRRAGWKVQWSTTVPMMPFPSVTLTTSCLACWSTVNVCITPWVAIPNSISASLAGSTSSKSNLVRVRMPPVEFVALDHLLHDMRLYKSRAEISAMRKSCESFRPGAQTCHATVSAG